MKISTKIVRKLRNNLTDTEKYLWYILRMKNLGIKFRRQAVIGNYIVDFVSFESKLIIEVDGSQHFDNKSDLIRDTWLQSQGFKVLRFWDNEVFKNRDGIVEKILGHIPPPLIPPHKGEGNPNPHLKGQSV